MTPREHFKNVDAFYINRLQDDIRRHRIQEDFDGVFKSLTRVEPVKFKDMKAQGIDYKKRLIDLKMNYDDRDLLVGTMFGNCDLSRFANRKEKAKSSSSPYTPEQYARAESLALTVKLILERFINSDLDRVMILEDDAHPRWSILDDIYDVPEADILIWGMYMHNTLQETKNFLHKKHAVWKKMSPGNGCFGSQAWELDRHGAEEFLKLYDEMSAIVVDVSRKFIFDKVTCYGLHPTGIIQRGDSTISNSSMQMALTREEAAGIIADYDKRMLEHRNSKLERQRRDMQILQEV